MPKRTRSVTMNDLALQRSLHRDLLGMAVHRALAAAPTLAPELEKTLGSIRAGHMKKAVSSIELMGTQLYPSVLDQYVATQLLALVKKFPFTPLELPGFDPEKAAMKTFMAAEHRCRRVNQRSKLLRYGVGFPYGDKIVSMRRYIRKVLGSSPNLPKIYDLCDWGPGASVGVTGDRTNFARKFLARKWTVTHLALSYATSALWANAQLRHLILGDPGAIVSLDFELFKEKVKARCALVTHNNINFVPKTYKTHRSIASEPLLNGFLQKGIDQYMRVLLRERAGIDLRFQEPNQLMARDGSIEGQLDPYATIDLSSASDSMSYGIAKTLLPPDWFELLNSARSHEYTYSGKRNAYQKFVSMGNGFCFPLQTLLFAAACHAICVDCGYPDDFRVYGDDIIVRRSLALSVIELLRYLGFVTNRDKTFVFGPFRESCGTDWYNGQDIRPVYVDNRLDSVVDLYKIHNASLLREFSDWFFEPIRNKLRSLCPEEFRFVRPFHGNPDGAFTVPLDTAMCSRHVCWDRKRQAWSWKELSTSSIRDRLDGFEPSICNMLEYLAVLRANQPAPVPLAVRRKARVSVRRKSYWGLPGHRSGADNEPSRRESGL